MVIDVADVIVLKGFPMSINIGEMCVIKRQTISTGDAT